MYYAIVGDIISSKSIDERRVVQNKLERYLTTLNKEYSTSLKKKIAVTLGDEFQGLFNDASHLLEIIHKIELEMYPIKLRFGLGIGEMEFDYGYIDSPYQSDGEVWWNARRAIDEVKKRNSKNKLEYFSNIYIKGKNDFFNKRINVVLDLCYSIKTNWTKKQIELIHFTINEYGIRDKFLFKDVAAKFSQSTSTIYGKYKSAKYLNYINVMNDVTENVIMEGENHAV
jgi:hypothetical protein